MFVLDVQCTRSGKFPPCLAAGHEVLKRVLDKFQIF
jgi:hypothetical protein